MVELGPLSHDIDVRTGASRPWAPSGFVRIRQLRSPITGEWVPCDIEIHADDLDRLERFWTDSFDLDYILGFPQSTRADLPDDWTPRT